MPALLTLVPVFPPRRTEKFPGNFPSSEETELGEELDEISRVKQIHEDTRELIFMPERKEFQIGRASSNPSKGIAPARDNAFFLSPVMSRYHAEVQMVEKKVLLCYLSSPHSPTLAHEVPSLLVLFSDLDTILPDLTEAVAYTG